METLRVIYARQHALSSFLIRAGAWWGPWSHCGVIDGSDVIEALALKGGVVRTPIEQVVTRSSEFDIVEIEVPNARLGLSWARMTVGAKYDWGGVFAIPFRERDWQAGGRWYCSEHVEATVLASGRARFRDGLPGIHPCTSYFAK